MEYEENSLNASFIFNAKKTKYVDLNEMLGITGYSKNIVNKDINFFIDTNFIFDFFKLEYYKSLTDDIINTKKTFEMAAEFLNLIGHYKKYFANLSSGETRFFIINAPLHGDASKEQDEITKNSYSNPKALKFLDFIINSRLKNVINAIDNIFIIDSKEVHKSLIPYVLFNSDSKDIRSLFTKKSINIFMAKSTAFGQYSFLSPNSFFFNKNRFMNNSKIFDAITSKFKNVEEIDRYGILFYQIMSGESSPFGYLDEKVKNRKIVSLLENYKKLSYDNYNDIDTLLEIYKPLIDNGKASFKSLDEVRPLFEERLKFYDIVYRYSLLSSSTKLDVSNNIVDCDFATDKEFLFKINNSHFNNEINLSMLI